MSVKPVLLVGHSPNKRNDPPLSPLPGNTAGRRLFEMSGWALSDWNRCCERMNLLPSPDASKSVAFHEADLLVRQQIHSERWVIVVGAATAYFFHMERMEWGEWTRYPDLAARITWIPHTSGLSRAWNEVDKRIKLRELFAQLHKDIMREQSHT